eukprot:255835_1
MASATCCNVLENVRKTCAFVSNSSKHVSVNYQKISEEIESNLELYSVPPNPTPAQWARDCHFCDPARPELTARYVFVLDALNFCFWPCVGFEYDDLARALRDVLVSDSNAFDSHALSRLDRKTLSKWLTTPKGEIPLLDERLRLLHELGDGLLRSFDGSVTNLIKSARGSAQRLVEMVTAEFPGFRDQATYKGHQIFFYKRAQILVGDLFAAFGGQTLGGQCLGGQCLGGKCIGSHGLGGQGLGGQGIGGQCLGGHGLGGQALGGQSIGGKGLGGQGLGSHGIGGKCLGVQGLGVQGLGGQGLGDQCLGNFADLDMLTCFADYRVPQILRQIGAISFSDELNEIVNKHIELPHGGEFEVEIRSATVIAVEAMVAALHSHGVRTSACQLDWALWDRAEALLGETCLPEHHRTLSIFY